MSSLSIPQISHRHFSSLARRLGRIFAHAYFHHREAFEQAEAESSLYARFLALTSKFDLVPAEFLVIPPRLEEREGSLGDEGEVRMPRLLGPHSDDKEGGGQQKDGRAEGEGAWAKMIADRPKSKSPPGLARGTDSPRWFGRNRTDTMVLSDAFSDLVARGDEYGAGPSGIRRDELEEVGLSGDVLVSGFLDSDTSDEPEEPLVRPTSNSPPIEDAHTFPPPVVDPTTTTHPEVNLPRPGTPEMAEESQVQVNPYVVPIEKYEDDSKTDEKRAEEPQTATEVPVQEAEVTQTESHASPEAPPQAELATSEYTVSKDDNAEPNQMEPNVVPSTEAETEGKDSDAPEEKASEEKVEQKDEMPPSASP
jgi:hypothetical protein